MLREQFIQLAENTNQDELVNIIDQLGAIPDEVSPVRELINRGNEQAIELLVRAAELKASIKESQRVDEEISLFRRKMDHVDEEITQFRKKIGMQQVLTDSLHTQHISVDIHFNVELVLSDLVEPIYRNVIYMVAVKGNVVKVEELLKRYGRQFSQYALIGYLDKNPEEFNLVWEKWVEGFFEYFKGNFYKEEEVFIEGGWEGGEWGGREYYVEDRYSTEWRMVGNEKERTFTINIFNQVISGILKKLTEKDSVFKNIYDNFFKIIYVYNNKEPNILHVKLKETFEILYDSKRYLEAEKIYRLFNNNTNTGFYWRCDNDNEIIKIIEEGLYNFIKDQAKGGHFDNVLTNLSRHVNHHFYDYPRNYNFPNRWSDKYIDAAIEGFKMGGFVFESKKIEVLYKCLQGIQQQYAFDSIEKLSLDDVVLQIHLLVECLYDTTALGKIFWHKEDSFSLTPSLKRGYLNMIVEKLKTMGVDLLKLPGFSGYSPAMSMWSKTIYPSKTVLNGKSPPTIIPMLGLEVEKDKNAEQKSNFNNALFQL